MSVLDLDAPIVPEQSLGGLTLRSHISELQDLIQSMIYTSTFTFGPMGPAAPFFMTYKFFGGTLQVDVDVRNGKIFQLTAKEGYRGLLFGDVGVGMRVRDVLERHPDLYYDEAEEVILSHTIEGVCLVVPDIAPPPELVPDMEIADIGVYIEEIWMLNYARGNW